MTIIRTNCLNEAQIASLAALWNREYPQQLCFELIADFTRYLHGLSNATHYLLQDSSKNILGWGFKFLREGDT